MTSQPAIPPDPTASPDDLILLLFVLVDDLYAQRVPDHIRYRPGHRRLQLSDSEVITLSLLQEACSLDSEASFFRHAQRSLRHLFPRLTSRDRYHRRRKALMAMHQVLFQDLAAQAEATAGYLIVDSAPVETVKFARSQSGKRSIPEAEYGYVAARKQVFFGLRLHALVSEAGAVVDFALTPADTSERDVARQMLDARAGTSVLADQGYSGRPMQQYAQETGIELVVTPARVHGGDRAPGAADRRSWRAKRARIESVFAALSDQFGLSVTRARSTLGVSVRVVAKVLAYNVSLVLNHMLRRPDTAIKSLFA
jgi:transposase